MVEAAWVRFFYRICYRMVWHGALLSVTSRDHGLAK